jgi:ribosomal protein L24E
MQETCKTCKEKVESGIFLSPQFSDEKVLLFCSEKCRDEHIKAKLERIKSSYPKYYEKLKKHAKSEKNNDMFEVLQRDRG